MLKAEIINLTSEFSRHSQRESFTRIIRKHMEFMGIETDDIIDISQRPEITASKISEAVSKANIVITIGGLCTHMNDLVKHTLVANFLLTTEFKQKEYDKLKKIYPNHSDDLLHRAAEYPTGAKRFESVGASGFAIEIKDRIIICLPSEPLEIYNMFSGQVLPYLAKAVKSDCVTKRTLFPKINITDGQNIAEQLSDVSVCVDAYKLPEGTVIMATGREGAVKTTMLACEEFSRNLKPKNPLIFSGDGAKERANFNQFFSKEKKPKKKWVMVSLLTLFVATAAVSGGYIGYNYYVSYINQKNNDRLQELLNQQSMISSQSSEELAEESTSENSESSFEEKEEKKILPLFEDFYSKNSDIAGWIKIEDTKINYPVMQSTDNEFYLKNDFDKKSNKYGIPFMDYENNFDERDKNIVIYGHNMNDGQMFGDLIKYRNIEFYKKHPVIEFNTLYEKGKYKIISGFVTNTKPEHGEPFDYHNKINFATDKEFEDFVKDIKIRSFFNAPVDVKPEDNLLTLSTCTYEFDGARFVLVARQIRDGESEEVDVSLAEENEPLLPDVWYKLFGGSPPAVSVMSVNSSENSNSSEKTESSKEESSSQAASSQNSEESSQTQSSSEKTESNSSMEASEPKSESSSGKSSETTSQEFSREPDVPSIIEDESNPQGSSSKEQSNKNDGNSSEKNNSGTEDDKIFGENEKDFENSSDGNSQWENDQEEDYSPSQDVMNEILKINANGKNIKMKAYDAICQIVENETRGNMLPEAIKAQAIASYTYVKYNNSKGIYPQVSLNPKVSKTVRDAVSAVLGKTIRYDGQLINATYHSTSRGKTASSKYVWGTNLPYLVSVDSPYDKESPYYKNTYSISDKELARQVLDTYGIDLYATNIHPSDWIFIDESRMNPGGYVGVVEIGGYDKSEGGTVERGTPITGRSVREKLLKFNLKSTAFDVDYVGNKFIFTTYGYGHGVGMSQWGAQGMAKDGYSYEEILTHYYTGTFVEDY